MSITLDIDTPERRAPGSGHKEAVDAKAFGAELDYSVRIGQETIGLKDFLVVAHYVLTNTDLVPNDPRRQFVDCVRAMREEEGWNGSNSVALCADRPPIPQ